MESLPVTFSNPEGQFCCLKPLFLTYLGNTALLSTNTGSRSS